MLRAAAARFGGWTVEHVHDGHWEALAWRRTAGCAKSIQDDGGTVGVRRGVDANGNCRAYFAGVIRCGSVWLCPVCTTTIRAHRADEVQALANAHVEAGGRLQMLTLTVRHHRTTPLLELYLALRAAYQSLQQSARWRSFRTAMVGQTVTVESTLGENGFHVHLHVLLLWEPTSLGCHRRRTRAMNVWGPHAWAERVERRLGERPSDERGWHLLDLNASSARYVAKITGEVTRGDYKSSDALDVMLTGVADGEAEACARYMEWADVMPGKRMIRFSPGLRELYLGEAPELSDDEVVNLDRKGELIGELDRPDYLGLLVATKSKPMPGAPRFLSTVEDTGCHPLMRPVTRCEERDPVDLRTKVASARRLSVGVSAVPLVLSPPWLRQAEHAQVSRSRPNVWERSASVVDLLDRCARSSVS